MSGPPSLLLVTLDTTRADRLGCYGREGAGTDALDALAARGARFERVHTPVPITLPAHTALLTGTYPLHNGVRDNGLFRVDPRLDTLAEVLAARGHRTGAVVAAYPLFPEYGLDQGFEFYDAEFRGARRAEFLEAEERPADEVVDVASAWLGSLGPAEPFFLWVHLFDPHWPYLPPPVFAARFPADPYQAEIAFTSEQVGRLLGELERLGRAGDTFVAVTADHGEGLGEHGEETHAFLLHDATTRVPLVLAGPGIGEGLSVEESVSLVDVLPTLCELLDVPAPEGVQGSSLAPLLAGGAWEERPVYLESHYSRVHYGWSPLEGVVLFGWKLVAAPDANRERDELYDLAADPLERVDRAAAEPDRLESLRITLDALRRDLAAQAPFDARHALTPEALAALEALGYAGAGEGPDDARGVDPRDRMAVDEAFLLGKALAQRGDPGSAREQLARIEAQEQGGFAACYLRALILTAEAHSRPSLATDALAAYDLTLALQPARAPVWRNRARAQRIAGDYAGSLDSLRTAVALAPAQPQLREELDAAEERARGELKKLEAAGDAAGAAALRAALEEG